MGKLLTSWLVPSFSQHNLCLIVSGRCLHVSVTKFQDEFASLRQVNSPNSWAKFQICCTDMYLIRFLPNFVVFCVLLWLLQDFADIPEFHGSATAQNIRSPVYNKTKHFLYLPRLQRSLFRQNQSNISLEVECNHYFPFFSVRFSLGVISLFAFSKFRSSISLTFGSDVGVFLALITASQFHLLFYLSRPLPNTFAIVLGK